MTITSLQGTDKFNFSPVARPGQVSSLFVCASLALCQSLCLSLSVARARAFSRALSFRRRVQGGQGTILGLQECVSRVAGVCVLVSISSSFDQQFLDLSLLPLDLLFDIYVVCVCVCVCVCDCVCVIVCVCVCVCACVQ